jgi:DNA-binding HxlR family transcriptional regulator
VKRPERRSPCPVACTLDLIGDRWTLLVVRDLACGKKQFREFLASPEGIATNILADRLAKLVDEGLARRTESGDARQHDYALTPKGRSLGSIVKAMARWGLKSIPGTEARLAPKFSA